MAANETTVHGALVQLARVVEGIHRGVHNAACRQHACTAEPCASLSALQQALARKPNVTRVTLKMAGAEVVVEGEAAATILEEGTSPETLDRAIRELWSNVEQLYGNPPESHKCPVADRVPVLPRYMVTAQLNSGAVWHALADELRPLLGKPPQALGRMAPGDQLTVDLPEGRYLVTRTHAVCWQDLPEGEDHAE